MSNINTEFANSLGRQLAAELNADPKEAQNWSHLGRNDSIPDGDYAELISHYGDELGFDDEQAVHDAYKAGFNAVFVPLQ